jgi:hypothetical protein
MATSDERDDLRARLRTEWPVRSFKTDHIDVVCMETPVHAEEGVVSRVIVVGFGPGGRPVATYADLAAKNGFSEKTISEFVIDTLSSEEPDIHFGETLNGVPCEAPRPGRNGRSTGASPGILWHLFRDFEHHFVVPEGIDEMIAFWDSVQEHLTDSRLPQIMSVLQARFDIHFDDAFTDADWYDRFGPDPENSWVLELMRRWPTFSDEIHHAACNPVSGMSRHLPDERNVAMALRFDATWWKPYEGAIIPNPFVVLKPFSASEWRRAERLAGAVAATRRKKASKLFWMLSECPQDWWPSTQDEWESADRAASFVSAIARETALPVTQLVRDSKGRWSAWCGILERSYPSWGRQRHGGLSGPIDLTSYADAVGDATRAFHDQIMFPALATVSESKDPDAVGEDAYNSRLDNRGLVATILFGEASGSGIMSICQKWHRLQEGIRHGLASISPAYRQNLSWAPGLPSYSWTSPSGSIFELTVLGDQRALASEGARDRDADGIAGLDHCVGNFSYLEACVQGRLRIVSVRRKTDDGTIERVSTAAIRTRGGNVADRPAQHYGRGNSKPLEEAVAAMAAYLNWLSGTGRSLIVRDDFADMHPMIGIAVVCGYDPAAPGAMLAALRQWEPVLRRPLRGLSWEEFTEAAGIGHATRAEKAA